MHLLPLAQRVRWYENKAGQVPQGVRVRELSLEAPGSRPFLDSAILKEAAWGNLLVAYYPTINFKP